MDQPKSLLFVNAVIITVDRTRRIFRNGALLVRGNRIVQIDTTETVLHHLPPDEKNKTTVIDCARSILIPGLINTHAHLAQSLLRGLAEDLPLHAWLCDAIWPLEANLEAEDGYVGARLTIAEMLKGGTTCFLEAMLTHRAGFGNVVRAVDELGVRACLGKLVKVEETNEEIGLLDPRDRDVSSMSIASALAAHEAHHGSCGDRLHVWMAASTPRGTPAEHHRAIGDAAAKHDVGLTMHCAEAPKDLDIYRTSYACTPARFCVENNLIGKGRKTVLAHMVNLDTDIDLPLLHDHEASISHNPASNCKLASGIAPVPQMIEHNVNVALGTDGAPCNNSYDMFQEMRLAGLIHRGNMRDAKILPAQQILDMATINAARALGLDGEIGSLEVGKKADFILVKSNGLQCAPFDPHQMAEGGSDPVTNIVFSCTAADVHTVVIDGRIVVKDRQLTVADEEEILQRARDAIPRIRRAANVTARPARNYV